MFVSSISTTRIYCSDRTIVDRPQRVHFEPQKVRKPLWSNTAAKLFSIRKKNLLPFLLALCTAQAVEAQLLRHQVETITVVANAEVDLAVLSGGSSSQQEILIVQTPISGKHQPALEQLKSDENYRSVRGFRYSGHKWVPQFQKKLEEQISFVDIAKTAAGFEMFGYKNSSVALFSRTTGMFETLFHSPTMFRSRDDQSSPLSDMFTDLNDDGLDDFMMPDFGGWRIALQDKTGFSPTQVLGSPPSMRMRSSSLNVAYSATRPFKVRAVSNDQVDLALWSDESLDVYRLQPDGRYLQTSINLIDNIDGVISGYSEISIGQTETVDEKNFHSQILEDIADINDDGIDDLVVKRIKSQGVLGWESDYQMFFGARQNNGELRFDKMRSTAILSKGFQFDTKLLDINGDGTLEFIITSAKISLGAIVRVLLTRTAKLEVSVFSLKDGQFPEKPTAKKIISAQIDFKSGSVSVPAVLTADVNGDGLKDLLVQNDSSELAIYLGEPSDRLFAKGSTKIRLNLPKTSSDYLVHDLDNDGRDELILTIQEEQTTRVSVVRFGS